MLFVHDADHILWPWSEIFSTNNRGITGSNAQDQVGDIMNFFRSFYHYALCILHDAILEENGTNYVFELAGRLWDEIATEIINGTIRFSFKYTFLLNLWQSYYHLYIIKKHTTAKIKYFFMTLRKLFIWILLFINRVHQNKD